MYVWIWHHLPFGRPGKIVGSLLLTGLTVALLWYVVFPWAEPLLPFDDVQVTDDGGVPGDPGAGPVDDPAGTAEPTGDDFDLPYSTESNNAEPPASPNR
ncbi:MAG TPA: hypothetical protein VES42_13500 [Pilimelia sp.]|nr:hypothetical protein [Pilimelia sp.]